MESFPVEKHFTVGRLVSILQTLHACTAQKSCKKTGKGLRSDDFVSVNCVTKKQ